MTQADTSPESPTPAWVTTCESSLCNFWEAQLARVAPSQSVFTSFVTLWRYITNLVSFLSLIFLSLMTLRRLSPSSWREHFN